MSTTTADGSQTDQPLGGLHAIGLVFLPFAAGYFLSYVFRSANAIIAPQLIIEVGLNAGDLGFLTSVYFLTFAAIQIPLGVLLDHYGPRRVQSCFLLFAAAGSLLFAVGDSLLVLTIARGLIGLGVAGSLMSALKAFVLWFPASQWPIVYGCILGIGGIGAVAATTPMEHLLGITDWRGVFIGLAAITMTVSMIILAVVPEREASGPRTTLGGQLIGVLHVYSSPIFWRIAPITIAVFAANLSIQGLWSGPWLRDVGGFERPEVAEFLLLIAACMAVGSVLIGLIATGLEKIGIALPVTMCVGVLIFMGIQGAIIVEWAPASWWPWAAFGAMANIGMLAFTHLNRNFPLEYAGRVATGLNVFTFGGAFLAQYLIGEVIDLWPVGANGNYDPVGYFAAFGAIFVFQAIGFIWFLVPIGPRRMVTLRT